MALVALISAFAGINSAQATDSGLVNVVQTSSNPKAAFATSASNDDCLAAVQTFTGDQSAIPPGAPIEPYTSPPPLIDAWFNSQDIDERGLVNPGDQRPWKFAQQFARLLCYAAPGSNITAAYYFFRGTNGSNDSEINRPESDSEVVFNALQWLAVNRGVHTDVILDNTNTCTTAADGESCTNIMTAAARAAIAKRFSTIPGSSITYCVNGCFNTARYGTYPYAIEHEKFFTVSDTDFPGQSAGAHPLVISTSSNLARSQIRNYRQEASSIYDDQTAWQEFSERFAGMKSCATSGCALLGDPAVHNTDNPQLPTVPPNPLGLVQEGDRRIWVDPILRRTTDAGRGTTINFSPGRAADADNFNVFVNQFDGVDCDTDAKIRLAMFKLTDAKAEQISAVLKSLKSRGCDVKMLLTSEGGATSISKTVQTTLTSAGVDYKCTVDPMHTKMILIGPRTGNLGSVLSGTQNLSVAGQLYSEEHVVTYDARAASGAGREAIRAVYDTYQQEWFELSRGASKSKCTPA